LQEPLIAGIAMKDLWTEDAETIQKEMDSLVENKIQLICGRRGSENITKLPAVGKTVTKNGSVLVLLHPHEPTCSSETCTFYYNSKGNPLRVFECKRVKKAENFVGFEYPKQIFNIHRRKFERVETPNTSVVTFSFHNKQRIHNGTVGDISLEGAKLLVDLPGEIAKGAILCHVTMTICYRISNVQTVLLIPEAQVIWSKCTNEVTHTIGIKFTLSEKDQDALSNYIDLRLIEASYKAR
jgi:hypothetical protein